MYVSSSLLWWLPPGINHLHIGALGKTVFFAPLPSVAILNLSLSALKREGGREGGRGKERHTRRYFKLPIIFLKIIYLFIYRVVSILPACMLAFT